MTRHPDASMLPSVMDTIASIAAGLFFARKLEVDIAHKKMSLAGNKNLHWTCSREVPPMADPTASEPTPPTEKELKKAFKAFKKRLKLTALDDDSRLGRGALSGGPTGVFAIRPPSQFPQQVWDELCRQGKIRDTGHGLYELVKPS